MRKISFIEYSMVLSLSAALGIVLSSGFLYLSRPVESVDVEVPTIDYERIDTHKGGFITGQSPFKSVPSLSSRPELPEAPLPPDIPDMPVTSDKLVVLGLLPPDVCIIRKGADTVTARTGDDTKLGHIGNITPRGVYIDGNFIEIQ